MKENEIKNENGVTDGDSNNKLIKMFENQRINLNKDIIFLKEDILQDFKRIETNLNSKYEKQSSNTVNKLFKFESVIEAMKTKIDNLSEMILTDKNNQQNIVQLTEFKRKAENKMTKQETSIKLNALELREAINKYDRILTESVIYPGIIGNNGRFRDFHEMIDFILLSINQFNAFKNKNTIDFEEYAIKIDSLYKSLKSEADSIISSCNLYCAKQIEDYGAGLKKRIHLVELNIIEIKKEINEILINLDDKIQSMNDSMKKRNKATDEECQKIDKEMKEHKIETNKKIEIFSNDLNSVKKKLKNIYYNNKIDNSSSNQNSRINLKISHLGTSVVKKYIEGEISYNKIENPQGKKKIWKIIREKPANIRRNTFGPDDLKDALNNNFLKKSSGLVNENSDKESNRKNKKDYDDFSYSSFDKSDNEKSKNNKERKNVHLSKKRLKIPSLLNYDEYKTNDVYSAKKRVFQPLNLNKNLINDKIPVFTKLKSIGDSGKMFDYNNRKKNIRKSKSSFDLNEKMESINNNNKYDYYRIFDNYKELKIKNNRNKLNVVEVNFDSILQEDKEKDDLKNLIRKIKENKVFGGERKNQLSRKNKTMKLTKSNIVSSDYEQYIKNKMIKVSANKPNHKSYQNNKNFHSNKNSFNALRLYSSKYN